MIVECKHNGMTVGYSEYNNSCKFTTKITDKNVQKKLKANGYICHIIDMADHTVIEIPKI